MSGLILVLNRGSSSIKSALFDASRTPLDRTPRWSGKVDGITGPGPTCGEAGIEPAPIALDPSGNDRDALGREARSVLAPWRT